MKTRACIVLGAGGHARVLLDTMRLAELPILGIVDSDPALKGTKMFDCSVLGDDSILEKYSHDKIALVNGIGSIDVRSKRVNIFVQYKERGFEFQTVIHPSAIVSKDVEFGEGAQIMAGTVIQPGVRIGKNSIINTRASVDHDCIIEDHVHIAPGAVLSGGVQIDRGAHIGTGAVVIQGIHIGADAMIAAGAVVVRDVLADARVAGVPTRPI